MGLRTVNQCDRSVASLRVAQLGVQRAASTQAASGTAAWRSLTVHGLDGTAGSLEIALRTLREVRPQQLMLETCVQRRDLAVRRAAAEAETSEAASIGHAAEVASNPSGGSPLSHVDAIATVHGGLRGADVAALCDWAVSADVQVYPVDRAYQETQNLVARRLLLRPRELLDFVRHSAAMLTGGAGQAGTASLSTGMREILEDEREEHMAAEVLRRAVRGADVAILCTSSRAAGLERQLLSSGGISCKGNRSGDASRIWPFLMVLLYVIVPAYGTALLAWRASRLVAAKIQGSGSSSWEPPDVASAGTGPCAQVVGSGRG